MNQPPVEVQYGVGACGSCRHVFLVTPELRNCPLCDRPADRVLAFAGAVEAAVAAAETSLEGEGPADAAIPFTVTCPHCDKPVLLEVTQEAISVVAPSIYPLEEEPGAPASESEPPASPPAAAEEPQEPMAGPHDPPPVGS